VPVCGVKEAEAEFGRLKQSKFAAFNEKQMRLFLNFSFGTASNDCTRKNICRISYNI
jgi:hypothetical protein